jgi:hypothetical protein
MTISTMNLSDSITKNSPESQAMSSWWDPFARLNISRRF